MMNLIFATHNLNKFKEIKSQMPQHIHLQSLSDLNYNKNIPEPFESLEENAAIKANTIHREFNKNCFSDDTGLFVSALGGAPGVFSARYAGEKASTLDNINKLLTALEQKEDRSAYFKTVIVLKIDSNTHYFEGVVKGYIAKKIAGTNGFGYDPVFVPEGYKASFAQLPLITKHKIGHRGKAINALIEFLKTNI
jgi:XTP/dITP diphosphohydrolase